MSVVKSPPTPFPAFAWPAVDTTIPAPQLATQLNTRMKQLQATLGSLTAVAQGTENWTHVVSANYPAKMTDQTLALDATNGNVSALLPTSQNAPGKVYVIIRTDASANTATVTTQGADLFEPGGGTSLTVTTAGQQVQSDGQGHWWLTANVGSGGGGAVTSVFSRTGAVAATSGDYSVGQITGAAPLASPALTGTPTAPTQAALSNNTDIATTAYVDGAVATQAALNLPLTGGTMTGIITLDGVDYTLTLVNDANYTPNTKDQIIVYTAISTTRLVILTNLNVGQRIEVWDGTSAGSAGTNNINFSVSGSVKVNAITNGQIQAVGFPNGCATAVQVASNTWAAQSAPIPNLPFSAGQITVTTQIKFNTVTLFTAGSSSPAVTINGGFELNSNTQTISSSLTLQTGSPVLQILTASGGNQTVIDANTGGVLRYVRNAGSSNNLTIQVPSGTTVATIPPGGWLWYYVNNSAPIFNIISQSILYAKVDLSAQAAAVGPTTLYAVPTGFAGAYRISWEAVVTQAATASSTLGGAGGFQITYTDNDTGTAITPIAQPNATATGNTVGTQLSGVVVVDAQAGTNIQYNFGYTSSGATVMQYALHIRLEYLT